MPCDLNGATAGSLRVAYPRSTSRRILPSPAVRGTTAVANTISNARRRGRLASVLWRPPGASRFACRSAWRGQVAYASQFADATDRYHLAQRKLCRKLGESAGNRGLENFPPKPKSMRWRTYERWRERYELQEERLNAALLRFYRAKWPRLKAFE
jgi:hypothetical protein